MPSPHRCMQQPWYMWDRRVGGERYPMCLRPGLLRKRLRRVGLDHHSQSLHYFLGDISKRTQKRSFKRWPPVTRCPRWTGERWEAAAYYIGPSASAAGESKCPGRSVLLRGESLRFWQWVLEKVFGLLTLKLVTIYVTTFWASYTKSCPFGRGGVVDTIRTW